MGTRNDFEEMNRYLEEKNVHFDALLEEKSFKFEDAEKAYQCLASGKSRGKIVIEMA